MVPPAAQPVRQPEPGRERPHAGVGVDRAADDAGLDVFLAVAEVGGEGAPSDAPLTAGVREPAGAVAEVVGGGSLAAVGCDLRLAQRTGQPQVLVVGAGLERQACAVALPAQVGERVLLAQPVVVAIVVGVEIAAVEIERYAVAAETDACGAFIRAVGGRAAVDVARALPARGRLGDDVDGAAGRSPAVEHGARAAHDLDALERYERDAC